MRGLGSYTLGDQYISPQRRLSQMLTQQGSKGGPSGSWQESLGRIAQQLSGAYIGMQDQKQQDAYLDTIGKTEPDSFRPPTDAEAMAAPGMRDLVAAASTRIAGDGRGQTYTPNDEQLMKMGGIPGIIDKISQLNAGLSGYSNRRKSPYRQPMDDIMNDKGINEGIDLEARNFEKERTDLRVEQPRDFKAELAQGMQDYQADDRNRITNEKKPQLDFMIENLQAMPNNTYARRGLAQALMQRMDRDEANRLYQRGRDDKLEDATRDRGYAVDDRDIRTGATAPKSQEISLPDGMTQRQIYVNGEWVNDGGPYDKNIRSVAAQEQAIDRKSFFDPEVYKKKETIKADAKGNSYSKKPMPASALKVQDDHIAAINTSKGLDADLGKWDEMITSGELDLGFFTNPLNKAKTYTGFGSDEQSRNYSSFRTSLEKMRNESLRLNKGIQTEGDAQRIWNELISNVSDEEFVSQRLKELQAVNKRAVDIRKYQIDSIRNNYGKGPLEDTPNPTAIPGTGSKGKNFVYVPGQGIVPEKRGQ